MIQKYLTYLQPFQFLKRLILEDRRSVAARRYACLFFTLLMYFYTYTTFNSFSANIVLNTTCLNIFITVLNVFNHAFILQYVILFYRPKATLPIASRVMLCMRNKGLNNRNRSVMFTWCYVVINILVMLCTVQFPRY